MPSTGEMPTKAHIVALMSTATAAHIIRALVAENESTVRTTTIAHIIEKEKSTLFTFLYTMPWTTYG